GGSLGTTVEGSSRTTDYWLRPVQLPDPLDGLDQSRGFDGQGGADVAVGGPAEADTRRGHDVGFLEQPGAQLGRGPTGRARNPHVEGRPGCRDVPADLAKGREERVAALPVQGPDRGSEALVVVERHLAGELDG